MPFSSALPLLVMQVVREAGQVGKPHKRHQWGEHGTEQAANAGKLSFGSFSCVAFSFILLC